MFKLSQAVCLVLFELYLVTASNADPLSPDQIKAIQSQIDHTINEKIKPALDDIQEQIGKRLTKLDAKMDEIERRLPRPSDPADPETRRTVYIHKHVYIHRHIYTPRPIYWPRWDDCWW